MWTPAQTDSVAILNYYNQNKSKYNWNKSVDAVIFYSSDATTAKTFSTQLKKSPRTWDQLLIQFSEKISADSARFELQQIPNPSKLCQDAGITVPILPGLKPISTKKQLSIIPRTFHVDIPEELSTAILKCKTDAEVEIIGTEWLLKQSKELKAAGVPGLHYYTLGKPHMVSNVVKEL